MFCTSEQINRFVRANKAHIIWLNWLRIVAEEGGSGEMPNDFWTKSGLIMDVATLLGGTI
jgi:hypothetical protein